VVSAVDHQQATVRDERRAEMERAIVASGRCVDIHQVVGTALGKLLWQQGVATVQATYVEARSKAARDQASVNGERILYELPGTVTPLRHLFNRR
jgi:hypothetical protein